MKLTGNAILFFISLTLVMGSLKKSDRAAPIEKKGTRKKKAVVPVTA